MITRYIQKILFVLLLFISQLSHTQTYPVQAVPTVTSPYSSKLSDYSNAMVNRINLQLITTDLLVQNRPALLQLRIQGNGINAQSTPILSGIQPIYLNGGEILSLTSADLAGYFRFQNLQGITTTRYSDPLPDGVYTICFQVYDMVIKKWLSQNSCATIYLMLNDPPQLNVPSNNEQIASSDFPNIIFSWTPRHMNATNVSYEYELKEILNTNLDPAFAFEVSPLLHKEEGLRTTTLLYDISKPVLIPGKTYAWRVKAISTNGLAENSVFKNNGYSQIYSFKYTSNCTPPRYLLSEQQSASRVKIMWQGVNAHRKYHVQYRKANVDNAQWFETHTVNTQTFLQDLEPGSTYEFRVGATCEAEQYGITSSYIYSGIQTFSIDASENATVFNCGIVPEIEITNQQPLTNLIINETFMAGDFPVKVLEISGSNGVYSGKGFIKVPYLFDTQIGVEFTSIRINTDYKLIDGVVETTYDPDWSNVDFVDDLWDVNQQSVTVNFPINSADNITINNGGEIVVTGPDGQTETFPGGKDTVITDSENKNYYVDADGNVSGPLETANGGKPTPENTDGVNKNGEVTELTAEGVRVVFEKHTDTQYAFDQVVYNKDLTSDYKKVGDAFVPFKAVPNGLTDKLWAKVTLTGTDVVADSIFFKTQNGIKVDAVKEGDHFVLTLKGAQKFALEEVQATIKQGDKYKIAGVFTMVHVSPKTLKLNLVPTKGVTISDAKINEIKAVYKQLAIDVQVEVEEKTFKIDNYLVGGKIPTEDTFGDLSTYSEAQKAIINAYKSANNVEKAYYIFVTDKKSSTGQSGYMKLNGQFGFVFDQNAITIAHELAHGAFKLEHPFKKFKNKDVSQGTTQSLMDYPPMANFLFTDWKQINDPAFKLYAFQSQSDGEFKNIRLTPDWLPFIYEGSNEHGPSTSCFNNGGICSIVGIDKEIYTYKNGDYYSKEGKSLGITIKPKFTGEVLVVNYLAGCGKLYKVDLSDLKVPEFSKDSDLDFTNKIFTFVGDVECDTNQDTYENLNTFGKLVYDENKKQIPEADYDILLEISKIAQELDVEVYNSFVDKQRNNGAMFWHTVVNHGAYSREKLENTYQHFIDYKNALDKLNNYQFANVDELVNHVREHFQITKGSDNVFTFPSDPKFVRIITPPFKVMNAERKKQLLDLLNTSSYTLFQNVGDDIGAGRIITTLFSTTDIKTVEALSLFNYTIEKDFLKHFVEDLNGVDYDGFMNSVINIALYHTDYSNVHLDAKNPNYIKFTDALLEAQNLETMVSSNLIRFEVNKWDPTIQNGYVDYYGEKYRVNAKPLDPVVVEFTKNIKLGNYQIEKGTKIPLPAIMAYDLFWQDTKAARWKSLQVAAEVGLTALGVGEVIWAVRAYRTAQTARATFLGLKAVGDLGVGFTDIYIQNTETLTEEQLNKWNKFVLLYSVGSFSTSAIDGLVQKFGKKAITNSQEFTEFNDALNRNNIDLDFELNRSAYKSQINELTGVSGAGKISTATKIITKERLPSSFVDALKKFGKSEDDILDYFTKYHNERSGQKFFNDIEDFMSSTSVHNLTRDEAFGLWGYTTNYFYKDLNAWLRNGTNIAQTSEMRTLLNAALNKLPNYNGVRVFRGIEINPSQIDDFIASYANGSSKVWNDFTSCGGSVQSSFGGRPTVNVIFEIEHTTAKEITSLADGIRYGVPPMPAPEILIKAGSTFKVIEPPFFDKTLQKWVIKLKQTQ